MTGRIVDNYQELCRLCASYDSNKLNIFSDSGKERNLVGKIASCLSFEVSKDDLYPKSLCFRCIYNLENFYDFRRGCIDARAKLEKAIKRFKRLKIQDNRLPDLPEITIEHKTIKKEEDNQYHDDDPEPPNPADFLEACLGDSPFPQLGSQISITRHFVEEEDVPHPCKICGRVFNSKSSLSIHAKFHQDKARDVDNKEPYSCYVCEKVFSSKGHLALHSRVHIGETGPPPPPALRPVPGQIKLYRCDLCNKSYSMAKHLWGHVSTAHKGDPLVTCGVCLRTFSSISNLEEHKKVKHKNEVEDVVIKQEEDNHVPCDEGPMDLSMDTRNQDMIDIKPPMMTSTPNETTIKRIVRESPPLELPPPRNPEKEQPNIKSNDTLVFSCLLCGMKFDAPDVLSQHLTNEHNYRDPIDFNAIRNQFGDNEFAENMMEAETVFCCEICYREFNDRASLWLHMLYSHRDEASKACGICLKVCPNTESLGKHVESCHPREKTEQRRYSCQVCARQHDSRKKLVTHARIHKIADLEGNLVDPETIVILNSGMVGENQPNPVSNNEGFLSSCDICFKVFENEAKLSKHKRSTHKDGVNTSATSNYHFFFACELCGLSHLSRAERWKHMVSDHNGDPSVTCEKKTCGKVFPTSSIKKEHEANHHKVQGEYPNTCEICGKMWKTRVEYWKHMMGVHSENLPFVCGVCLKVFCDLQGLVTHVREKHWPLVGGDFCCDICGRPYSKISKMSRHRKVHFSVDAPPELQDLLNNSKIESQQRHFLQNQTTTLTCDLCVEPQDPKEEFENIETLGKHRFEKHNVMPCDLCPKYYGRTSHLWKHVNKIHKGHPDITCPVCQRTSASRGHLATHMTKHHRSDNGPAGGGTKMSSNEDNGVHTCPKCSKIFRKESLVRKHLKHCKGPRPTAINLPPPVNGVYTCERCSKTFIAQNLLNKHMRNSHVTFKCEICEVKSNTKTELFNHIMAEHSEHPDVKCAVTGCDKLLRCKADLDRHQRDHRSSTQLHICKFCAEIVTSKVKLKMHLKGQHAKEAKHLCALCLKALKDFTELRSHIVEDHRAVIERPNTCQVCAKPCSSRSKLMDHTRNHGPEFHPCKICLKIFPSKEELDRHCENHPESGDEEEEVETDVAADEVEEVDKLDASSIIDIIGAPQGEKVDGLDPKSIRDIIGAGEGNVKLNQDKHELKSPPNKKMKLILCCDKCPLTFGSKLELNDHKFEVHQLLPTTKKNYLLSELYKKDGDDAGSDKFMQQLGLMPEPEKKKGREIRRTFDDDYTPSPCVLCGKVWPAKRHLWQHLIRYHKTEAGRCCGVCLKLCSNYTSLSIHLAVHHRSNFDGDGTNMLCKVCGKYHNGRTKLLNHSLIHYGHEDRACDLVHHCLICKSSYPEFPALIEHLQQGHNLATEVKNLSDPVESDPPTEKEPKTNNSPFLKCEVCSLVFASEMGLTNHRRTHEHSDNFKCGQCGEIFDSADGLKNHTAVRHVGDDWVCTECKAKFNSYEELTSHNKRCKLKRSKSAESESDEEEEEEESEDDNDTTALESDDKSAENEEDEEEGSSISSSSSSSSSSEDEDEEEEDAEREDEDDDEEEEEGVEEDGGRNEERNDDHDIENDVEEDVEEDELEESIEEEMDVEDEQEAEAHQEPSEIRAIEAYVCDNMEGNMYEVVKIELTDDIDGAVKSS